MSQQGDLSQQQATSTDGGGGMTRRRWIGGAALGGAAVVGGAVGVAATASAQDSAGGEIRRESLVLDVACDGSTFREQPFPDPPDPGDRRGSPFSVEGWIYPEGTLSDGFLLTEDGSIGRWFCAGFTLVSAERPEPHANATANFVFGTISEDNLFPEDTIATFGLAGTSSRESASNVPVIGGTGRYLGAMGSASRTTTGLNNTVLFGPGVPGPNFRYVFDLILVG